MQLLDCLIRLSIDDNDQSFLEIASKQQYIALKCVHYLKPLGFKLSIAKFEQYDKLKILKQIWSTNANNPDALRAIKLICVGYDIYEVIIWNNLLKQMVKLYMTKELSEIIDTISIKRALMNMDGLVVAYDYLIRLPFKSITRTQSIQQDEKICEALFMLQSCPVKHKIDIFDLAKTCISLGQIHIAAVLLALIDDEHKERLFNVSFLR